MRCLFINCTKLLELNFYSKCLKKPIYFVSLSLLGLQFSGCKKLVQVPPPKNEIVTTQVFSSDETATSAVLGIYINIMESGSPQFANGGITIFCGLSADEISTTTNSTDENQFFKNEIAPNNNDDNGGLWANGYKYIYQANACLDGIQQSTNITGATRQQLNGELKFIRAFSYFNLMNLYGPVPLVTTDSYQTNQNLPRLKVDSIYIQIIQDLLDAENLLSSDYVTNGKLRPNKFTAEALLSKVYLYDQNWSGAEDVATSIISSGLYDLDADLNSVFLANSSEAIWQLSPVVPGAETVEGSLFVTQPGNMPSYPLDMTLVSSFENGDQRGAKWIGQDSVNGQLYFYPFKYKLGTDGNSTPVEDYMVFRLGEQYLIRAEAAAELGDLANGLADLNIIRNRAGLSIASASTKDSLLALIMHERQVELFCEWGNRWFDLKRTGKINAIIGLEKPGWSADASLFPIPFNEISTNPFLTQNAGYF